MPYQSFYKKLEGEAKRLFPGLAEIPAPTWDHLISPLELHLPKSIYTNAARAIEALHSISRRAEFQNQLESMPGISDVTTRHESVLMAYDFHSSEAGECSLVEVNTNASGFLLASLMEAAHFGTALETSPHVRLLMESFASELALWGKGATPPSVAITDEDIVHQKMYAEFLMYRDLFRAHGWQAEFCEGSAFTYEDGRLQTAGMPRVDLVYNRLTDFYLQNPQHQALRSAFAAQDACITPNPREYWLLADKQRLVQLSNSAFLQSCGATPDEIASLEKVLIPTFEKSSFASREEIWSTRKNLFFKPRRSYGGKSVYRGESVSRKVFERLMHDEDILIQHFRPAQKVPTDDPRSVLDNWKFDLRFFVYRTQIQLVVARIYQGQVTNFASPLGGFTLVRF